MKILINTSNIRIGGILQVTISFITELRLFDMDNNYFIVLSKEVAAQINIADFPRNFNFITISTGKPFSKKFFQNIYRLKRYEKMVNPDIVFSTFAPSYWTPKSLHVSGFAYGLAINPDSKYLQSLDIKKKVIVSASNFFKRFFFKRNSQYFIGETDDVKARLVKYFGLPDRNVFTVSNTCSNFFFDEKYVTKDERFHKGKFKLISISANFDHKNLVVINAVTDELRKREIDDVVFYLTIDGKSFAKQFSHNQNVVNIGPVTNSQCPSLYFSADAMFLPTLLESFTATYPEAMAMRRPILTSDLSFAHSICADAAVYFNPYSASDIVDKIMMVRSDKSLYDSLVNKGIERLKFFPTANQRAQMYLEICEAIVNKHRGN